MINESYRFSEGKSCLTNVRSFYRKVNEAADKVENNDLIYLEINAAFDKVGHQTLE